MTEVQDRKRHREPEVLADSIDVRERKRFHSEDVDRFLPVLQLDQSFANDDDEEFASSGELLNEVMRSLEKGIAATCSNSTGPDITSGHEGQTLHSDSAVNLSYLMEASDEELGIPPIPVLDFKKEVCQSSKDIFEDLMKDSTLKSIGENWYLEKDSENYEQSILYGNSWDAIQLDDYVNRDFISQTMLIEGDFS